MKTIHAGQFVKHDGLKWGTLIIVATLESCVPGYYPTLEAAWEHHREFDKNNPYSYNPTAWTSTISTMICADYPGKARDQSDADCNFNNAIMLKEGEIVLIEGRKYSVHIVNRQVSDPIQFNEVPESV